MRFLLVMVVVGGCAVTEAETGGGALPCVPRVATVLSPPLDAVVPPPSVDIRVRWERGPGGYAWASLTDSSGTFYPSIESGEADGVHVYHYTLPPSSAFTFEIVDLCFHTIDDMHPEEITLAMRRLSTGP
jgi:hypothetical protein